VCIASLFKILQIDGHEMIKSEYYRLGEYKIIEGEDGYIWWETHSGFCSVKMGRCFVRGSILFIEPGHTSEENGFLKGEFLDQLKRLPKWEKTKYYITSFRIFKCNPDHVEKSPFVDNKFSQPTTQEDVSYRLGKFEIFEKSDGSLLWKSYSGRAAIKTGQAFVDGNILFLGRGESEKTVIIEKDFLGRLSLLPAWGKTHYFCEQYTLYSCETNATCYDLNEFLLSNKKSGSDAVVIGKRSTHMESDIKPKTVGVIFTQNSLKPFLSFCSISFFIILKVLFLFIRTVFNVLKLFFRVCALGWERVLKWGIKTIK